MRKQRIPSPRGSRFDEDDEEHKETIRCFFLLNDVITYRLIVCYDLYKKKEEERKEYPLIDFIGWLPSRGISSRLRSSGPYQYLVLVR